MSVSIIIPSLNSPLIGLVIQSVLQQEGIAAVSELLIVGKDEAGLIGEEAIVRLIDTVNPVNAAVARNIGIEVATGEVLIFLDSDCLPQSGWLQAHMQAQQAGWAVVGGGVLPQGDNYWSLSYNLTLFHEYLATSAPTTRQVLPTLNLSVRRDVIQKVGNLNETLVRGQDIDWTARMSQAGFQLYFLPGAAVHHRHNRTTLLAYWRDCVRSGHHMRQIRLANPKQMGAPFILRYPLLLLLLSPLIASWVTGRIIWKRPFILRRYPQTIPAIYLSKLAWCWGAVKKEI